MTQSPQNLTFMETKEVFLYLYYSSSPLPKDSVVLLHLEEQNKEINQNSK